MSTVAEKWFIIDVRLRFSLFGLESALGASFSGAEPGFRAYPNIVDPSTDDEPSGFYVDEYELDQDHWSDGFGK